MEKIFVNIKCVGIENIKEVENRKSIATEIKSTGRASIEVNFKIKK